MIGSFRNNALIAALALVLPVAAADAASLAYHGTLQDAGKAADGNYDIQLTLYSSASGGRALGAPVTLYGVPVHGGSFNTQVDFGSAAKTDGASWVGAKVRPAGTGEFVALDARTAATIDAPSTCNGTWALDGNIGNPAGSYLGTADNQPLQFMVNGERVGNLYGTATAGQPNVIFGGSTNVVYSNAINATISGGSSNTVGAAGGDVAGGSNNTALGVNSYVAGWSNLASGPQSAVPGGEGNHAAGRSSFAGGYHAQAGHDGSFVWSDFSSSGAFATTASNQFLIRATGGVGIGTNDTSNQDFIVAGSKGSRLTTSSVTGTALYADNQSTTGSGNFGAGGGLYASTNSVNSYGAYISGIGTALYVQGPNSPTRPLINSSVGANLSAGGQWVNASDRNIKSGFAAIDVGGVLAKVVALPVTNWFYKREGESVRHIGPVAQDFYAAFDLGNTDKGIGTVDEGGVALAAIQGLNKKLETENASLHTELAELRSRIDAVLGAKGE